MMHHMNAPHWMMWDIPADVTSLPTNIARMAMPPVPAGAKQAKPNVDGSTWYGYSGPCPGSPNRQYDFDVYALDVATLPGVTPDTAVRTVITAVRRSPAGPRPPERPRQPVAGAGSRPGPSTG